MHRIYVTSEDRLAEYVRKLRAQIAPSSVSNNVKFPWKPEKQISLTKQQTDKMPGPIPGSHLLNKTTKRIWQYRVQL